MSLKSLRDEISLRGIRNGISSASFSTLPGKLSGKPNSTKMASISASFSPGNPKIFIISPDGFFDSGSHSIIRATAFTPFCAPFNLLSGIKISTPFLVPSFDKKAKRSDIFTVPT